MDIVANGINQLPRQSLGSDVVCRGKGSQSTVIYNVSGKKKLRERNHAWTTLVYRKKLN